MTPHPMAQTIELWPTERLLPYARNARTHSETQVAQIAASIAEFGFTNPILVDTNAGIIAGHGRLLAARKLKLSQVPVVVLDHLSETQKRAYILADNRLAESAGWDEELLSVELEDLREADVDLATLGFSESEVQDLLGPTETATAEEAEDEIPGAPQNPVTAPGDLWLVGDHRLLCGNCRDAETVSRLFAGKNANVVVTSPPYASQRKYDEASGFRPVPPDEYLDWFRDIAANIKAVLAPDGSYFLNIKEHCEDGQRHLYVKDLTLAHVRQWGWRLVDEFCWVRPGVPMFQPNRFKNGWEPVFHFALESAIKMRHEHVKHETDDYFYAGGVMHNESGGAYIPHDSIVRKEGMALPSNVLRVNGRASSEERGDHPASFPVGLPGFFILAFTDEGDIVFDPFVGSGTTMVAALKHRRIGYAMDVSPRYCDVIIQRLRQHNPNLDVRLESTGQSFEQVAVERLGVDP